MPELKIYEKAEKIHFGSEGVRTLDLRFTRATPYHLATKPT